MSGRGAGACKRAANYSENTTLGVALTKHAANSLLNYQKSRLTGRTRIKAIRTTAGCRSVVAHGQGRYPDPASIALSSGYTHLPHAFASF
jgi:hypothetical protein